MFTKPVKPPSYAPRKFTIAHVHELLNELMSEHSLSEHNEVAATKDDPDSESTLLVNSTSANSVRLGDIRKLISTSDKSKSTSNKKQAAFSNENNVNGKPIGSAVSVQSTT